MELGKNIWYLTIILTLIVIQVVHLSPLNSIQDSSKDDFAPCSYDCTTKEGFCKNGGVCVKVKNTCSSSSYICDCPNGYEGKRCDQIVAICKYDDLLRDNCGCKNGATCRKVDSLCARESYKCVCTRGFEGIYCDVRTVGEILSQRNVTLTSSTTERTVDFIDPQNASDVFHSNSSSSQPETTSVASTSTQDNISAIVPPNRDDVTTTSAAHNSTTNMAKRYRFNLTLVLRKALDQQRNKCPGCQKGQCEKSKCVCDSGYVGKNCDKNETLDGQVPVINAVNTTRAGPVVSPVVNSNNTVQQDEGDCYINFKCIHGICNKTDPDHPICICERGYVGDFCNIMCSKDCHNGGVCIVHDDVERCACTSKFTGEFCNETKLIDDSLNSNLPNPKTPGDTVCSDKLKCIHGECDKSDPGKHQCRCHEGFTGASCDIPCSKLCQNGGECRVNNEIESCHCPANLWGELCEKVVNASIAPPEASAKEGEPGDHSCAKNFKCYHGVCKKSAASLFRCVCDDGYTGYFCHIKCTKLCKNDGKCTRMASGKEVCLCPGSYVGEFCAEKKIPELKQITTYDRNRTRKFLGSENGLATKRSVTSQTDCTKLCPTDHRCVLSAGEEKCERTTASIAFKTLSRRLRLSKAPRSSRYDPKKCSMNFICVHGVCDNSDPWRPRCVCDDGFVGAFCHQECTLQCSNGGRCVVLSGVQYCNCKYGYSGRFCDTMVYFDTAKGEKQTVKNETSEATTMNPSTTGEPA